MSAAAAHALTQQFLAWVDEGPRSYADADAWQKGITMQVELARRSD